MVQQFGSYSALISNCVCLQKLGGKYNSKTKNIEANAHYRNKLHYDKMNIRYVNKSLIHNYKKGIHW